LKTITSNIFAKVNKRIEIALGWRDLKMQKIKITVLFSKFTSKDNPFRAIIPFLLATLFFAVTITPLCAQLTQESTPSLHENSTNLATTKITTASSKPEVPQPTTVFCPNWENQLLKIEGSWQFYNSDFSQWYQTTKK
jgi:hypothetical protein